MTTETTAQMARDAYVEAANEGVARELEAAYHKHKLISSINERADFIYIATDQLRKKAIDVLSVPYTRLSPSHERELEYICISLAAITRLFTSTGEINYEK